MSFVVEDFTVYQNNVYFSGEDIASYQVPYLIKNGVMQELPRSTVTDPDDGTVYKEYGKTATIYTDSTGVYVAGDYHIETSFLLSCPCYWKDGIFTPLPFGTDFQGSGTIGMKVPSGKMIVVTTIEGETANPQFGYWVDSTFHAMETRASYTVLDCSF
jgi:hypothetical protein